METWKRTVYICAFCIFFMSLGVSQVSPILPLYFHEMGLSDTGSIAQWSGASMGITFLIVCLAAPFWGRLADRKGRKITLIRSSLGMAICSILLGFQTTPEGVFLVRTLQGLVSGFYPASVTLIASETPQNHTGWALGIIGSFSLAGSLAGPLVGGYLSDVVGIRNDFFIIGALMLISFGLTAMLVHENYVPKPLVEKQTFRNLKTHLPEFSSLVALSATSFLYAISVTAISPIMTVYIKGMLPSNTENIAFISGAVFSAMGIAQFFSSSPLGKLVDRIGPRKVLIYSIASKTPKEYTGQIFSYNQSCLSMGYFLGSFGGSIVAAQFGFTTLFWTCSLTFIGAALWVALKLK
ncbi:MFS transporter [Veillonella sp.]|uniref:MFS transporter n=1 Tax=Veillonella sp. TaxID=1926307 RepID=UPI0025799754|nr:MFS transporter [Veillonella sp.]MBS4892128.1 MFS transporter [Veillonella sp.]